MDMVFKRVATNHTGRSVIQKILTVALVIFAASCNCGNNRLEEALRLAGNNRTELEKVLEHYSHNKADSLKLRAARFLIENMPGHVSYDPEKIAVFREAYERIVFDPQLSISQKTEQLESIPEQTFLHFYIVEDVETISADYLISNIDRSFDIWENSPYCRHIDFDEFCELILPYKCVDLQELDNWKQELKDIGDERLSTMPNDETYDNTHFATKALTVNLKHLNGVNHVQDYNGNVLYNTRTLANMKFGRCEDYSISAVAIMRSKGIPACLEELPQWAQKPLGHAWHTIFNDNGVYMPAPWNLESLPGDPFFPDKKLPKIFRVTYAANPFFEKYIQKSLLKHGRFDKFQKDVTDLYIRTSDLDIPVKTKNIKEKYAYLAIFDNVDWNVVDLGVIKGNKARFDNVGQGLAYIVMGYDGERLVPISTPFIIETSGELRYCTPGAEVSDSVKLTRKYPKSASTAQIEYHYIGAQLEAANQRDFSDADTLFVIKDLEHPDLILVDTTKHYRYWRYNQCTPNKFCSLAELQFYRPGSSGRPVKGEIIANEPESERIADLAKAFDNNRLTSYTSRAWNGCWMGLDFGKPVSIENIRVVARSDDNGVNYGDKYELKYWDDGWVSLGEQTADERYLIYNDVPKGALLLLSNNSGGTEERIFTHENGEVRWW